MKVTFFIGFMLTMLAGTAAAECNSAGCSGYVDEIYMDVDGLWLQTSGNETLANCTPNSGVFLRLSGSSARFKEMYAMLQTAQVAGWQVFVRINDGSNPCTIQYIRLARQ
jgi:hypothetical protein